MYGGWRRGRSRRTNGDLEQAELGGEVEGGVAVVGEVGGLEGARVVFDDSFEEEEVVEVDGATEATGGVDHFWKYYIST